MTPKLHALVGKCQRNTGASPGAMGRLLDQHPGLPRDYLDVLLFTDGCEGWIGEHFFLHLYSTDALPDVNDAACVEEFAPGMLIIASDGGGMTYALDTRSIPMRVVELPSETLSWDEVWATWDSLGDCLAELAARQE